MTFFINNPWMLIVGIVLIVFISLVIVKIVREVRLNNLLKERQGVMRVLSEPITGIKKRVGILTGTALAPVAMMVVVLLIGSNITETPSGEIRNLQSSSDIVDLTTDYEEFLPNVDLSKDEEVDVDSAPEYNDSYESDDLVVYTTAEGIYRSIGSSSQEGEVTGSETLEELVFNDDYYFEIMDNILEVSVNSNEGATKEGTQFVDSIYFSGTSGACTNGYLLEGLLLDEDMLIVVSLEYPASCMGIEITPEYLYLNTRTVVSVIDVNDFSSITSYKLSGKLFGILVVENNVYITTKMYVEDFEDILPYYEFEGAYHPMVYDNITYIEGTIPSSYVTTFGINIETNQVDMESMLIDYNINVHMSLTEIQLSGDIYYFEQFSGLFELDDPIEEMKEVLITYDLIDGDVIYNSTEIK